MKPRLRIPARLILAGAMLSLAACAAVSNYSDEAPANGWNITGIWVLNPALSTDTQKALSSLIPRPKSRHGARPGGAPGSGPGPNSGPDGAGPDDSSSPGGVDGSDGPDDGGQNQGQGRGGGGRRSGYDGGGMGTSSGRSPAWRPPLDIQTAALAGGAWLQLTHRDDELVIANVNGSRSYTPGEHSVVSVDTGVADQSSGWKGHGYTIEIKPQIGPRSVEHYELSKDGRQLIVHIDFDSEGPNKALKVVRVYDRAAAIPQDAPQARP